MEAEWLAFSNSGCGVCMVYTSSLQRDVGRDAYRNTNRVSLGYTLLSQNLQFLLPFIDEFDALGELFVYDALTLDPPGVVLY